MDRSPLSPKQVCVVMADKPTVVLVHGFWGGAAHWAKVVVEACVDKPPNA